MRSLESRVQALEDRIEIVDLIAGYGPAVDSGDEERVGQMWVDDGEYTFGSTDSGGVTLSGSEIGELVNIPGHRQYMARGCGHVLTTPKIHLDGNSATAVNHSLLILKDGERWVVERASANRWELERRDGRWRVRNRVNALLEGDPAAFGLFAI